MTTFAPPVVAWRCQQDGERPLVVLLHGRGSDEADIVALADHLPDHLDYAAVRAPIAEGGGYAWFANRGIGRPFAESLSGGEAQRLKLSTELGRDQSEALFVLDEPTVGLHPLDVRTLLDVLERLIDRGATVVAVEHDLDMIANADYVVDMGPAGGKAGGRIVATGTPDQIANTEASATGRYLALHLRRETGGSAHR